MSCLGSGHLYVVGDDTICIEVGQESVLNDKCWLNRMHRVMLF